MRRAVALLLIFAACSENQDPAGGGRWAEPQGTDTTQATRAGGGEGDEIIGHFGAARYGTFDGVAKKGGQVVLPLQVDVDTFNPYLSMSASTNNLNHVIYPQAIRENADFHQGPSTFSPGLVDEWKVDGRQVRMHIRDDAVWSDGVPITAADARFSWQAATNKHVAWTNSSSVDFITNVEVVDDKTFVVHFSKLYPYMLYDARFWRIIPKHVYGKVPFEEWKSYKHWDDASKVSSGPFKVERNTRGEEVILVPNEKYWDKRRPRLQKIIFRVIKSQQTVFQSLLAGELDGMDFLQPRMRKGALKDPRFRVYTFDGLIYDYVGWNCEHAIFKDPEIRRAMTLAIDRENIVESLLYGQAKVMASPMMSTRWPCDRTIEPLPYDTEQALAILARKGWKRGEDGILRKDGKPFEFGLTTNSNNERRVSVVQIVQADLKEIGIEVHARIIDFNTMIENIRQGNEDAWVIGWWLSSKVDPKAIFHSDEIGGWNAVRWRDATNDRLLEEGRLELDPVKAKAIWKEWQHNWLKHTPYTLLYEVSYNHALHKRYTNVEFNAIFTYYNLDSWFPG